MSSIGKCRKQVKKKKKMEDRTIETTQFKQQREK